MQQRQLRKASIITFVVAALAFLLPFITFSCAGRPVGSLTGINLGMPGPPAKALEQREAVTLALEAVHQALAPFIEGLPMEDGTGAVFRLRRKIRGDTITVIFKPS